MLHDAAPIDFAARLLRCCFTPRLKITRRAVTRYAMPIEMLLTPMPHTLMLIDYVIFSMRHSELPERRRSYYDADVYAPC